MIDLKRDRRVWGDFYDVMIAEQLKNEPRECLLDINQIRHRKDAYR